MFGQNTSYDIKGGFFSAGPGDLKTRKNTPCFGLGEIPVYCGCMETNDRRNVVVLESSKYDIKACF